MVMGEWAISQGTRLGNYLDEMPVYFTEKNYTDEAGLKKKTDPCQHKILVYFLK